MKPEVNEPLRTKGRRLLMPEVVGEPGRKSPTANDCSISPGQADYGRPNRQQPNRRLQPVGECSMIPGDARTEALHRRMLRSATRLDLEEVASWISTRRECELWAGWRVSFPIDQLSLPVAIEFAETNAFSLLDADELVAFGQLVKKRSR